MTKISLVSLIAYFYAKMGVVEWVLLKGLNGHRINFMIILRGMISQLQVLEVLINKS